ncbi:hypothetical protein D3227_39585 [Mesorhizobium waimense]|uniref:Phosphoribosyltransferase domain-containing protein n=1 Tax=Mesorhizobium waimense TaxID=1300307 RepID=A0A3A5JP65_9HYPH|nr:phosphoribosyltransferase family protein [Mesorhizobium waimense]RJT22093.1 hypothetical protein D3227_39585 [Mesorhizobium waimense]
MSDVFNTLGNHSIVSLGSYKPWNVHRAEGGDRSSYPAHSGYVLDIKDNAAIGVKHFAKILGPELKDNIAMAVVPSHDPKKTDGGLHALVRKLTESGNRLDASGSLVRVTKIDKLAHGGDRSIEVHQGSIRVAHPELIKGRHVVLIDDVQKTGNSLKACRALLLEAGALSVQCLALASTW